jgi:hypothetical protein
MKDGYYQYEILTPLEEVCLPRAAFWRYFYRLDPITGQIIDLIYHD